MPDQFADFEIDVRADQVHVSMSPAGEQTTRFENPFDSATQASFRSWLTDAVMTRGLGSGKKELTLETPQQIGQKLFAALFPESIQRLYTSSRDLAHNRGLAGLRIKLRISEDLEHLPWELLCDPLEDYLVLTPRLSLVRYLDLPTRQRSLMVDGPLKVLVAGGWPQGLDLEEEIEQIRTALQPLEEEQRIALRVLNKASLDAIYQEIRKTPCHILHYLGHSEAPESGRLAQLQLHNASGSPQAVPLGDVWRVLRRSDALRLVWLNLCSDAECEPGGLTGTAASAAAWLVSMGLPAVIAN